MPCNASICRRHTLIDFSKDTGIACWFITICCGCAWSMQCRVSDAKDISARAHGVRCVHFMLTHSDLLWLWEGDGLQGQRCEGGSRRCRGYEGMPCRGLSYHLWTQAHTGTCAVNCQYASFCTEARTGISFTLRFRHGGFETTVHAASCCSMTCDESMRLIVQAYVFSGWKCMDQEYMTSLSLCFFRRIQPCRIQPKSDRTDCEQLVIAYSS